MGGILLVLTKKNIIEDIGRKATEIERKMEYCCPEYKGKMDTSYINLFTLLYYHELHHKPEKPEWEGRDHLLVTKGNVIVNLFPVLAETEYLGWKRLPYMIADLSENQNVKVNDIPGVESISENPELAMTFANGIALCGKALRSDSRVYVVIENVNDPRFFELIFSTSSFRLDNVVAIVKVDKEQYTGDIIHKWFTLGWHIEEVNFESLISIFSAFTKASRTRGKPTVLIGQ